jgi:hypothetical protein
MTYGQMLLLNPSTWLTCSSICFNKFKAFSASIPMGCPDVVNVLYLESSETERKSVTNLRGIASC